MRLNIEGQVACTIKWTEVLKHCFYVISYILFSAVGLFPHTSMATTTTCPGTTLFIKKTNWVE